jgi:hypothetical protein
MAVLSTSSEGIIKIAGERLGADDADTNSAGGEDK